MKTRIIATLAASIATASCLFSTQTYGQNLNHSQEQAETSVHPLVEAVAKAEGLTPSQALDFLDEQDRNITALDQAAAIAGDSFAGGWIDDQGTATVAVTDVAKAKNIEHTDTTARLSVQLATHTMDELKLAMDTATDLVERTGRSGRYEISLDEINNEVDISLPRSLKEKSLLETTASFSMSSTEEKPINWQEDLQNEQISSEIQQLEEKLIELGAITSEIFSISTDEEITELEATQGCNSRNDCFPYLRGGLRIIHPNNQGGPCTAGFNARSVTGQHYLITAGHCGNTNDHIYQEGGNRFIGVMDLRIWDGMDAARIKVLGPWKPTRWVWADSVRQAVQIRGTTGQDSTKGALVCYSGAKTGYHCGKIRRTHVTLGKWKDTWEADFRVQKGDSGGPVFLPGKKFSPTNVKAYGIVAAFSGNRSYGNGIHEIQRSLGVRVITD